MTLRRFIAVLVARNKEFWRDKATLGWALLFPILVLFGFSFIFSDSGQTVFQIAVLGERTPDGELAEFFDTPHIRWVEVEDVDDTLRKVGQHRFDLAVAPRTAGDPPRYWVNSTSADGAMAERVLLGSDPPSDLERLGVEGREVGYVDWFLPGLLGMNIMFGCLFGVGFVIVRYRKNGVLRRLDATPLSAFEFLAAQVVSRFFLVTVTTLIVYVGALALLDVTMIGSHVTLFLVFSIGTLSMIALGLAIASRTASEELAGGLLNMMTWPMMILSDVWFSLEGAPAWVQSIAATLPLTHLNAAARAIMIDGASLTEVVPELVVLSLMALVFLAIGSWAFRWE